VSSVRLNAGNASPVHDGALSLPAVGDEHGFSLIELLIAMALTAVAVAATLGVFGASGRTTVISQNTAVGAHQAQAELDRLSKLRYGELALTSTPVTSANLKNPNYRVSGNNFNVRSGLTEPLVTTAGDQATAKVDPGPTTFAVGQDGSTITGKVYRYVTWRDENCPATICDGAQNTKRVIVAVSLDPIANSVQRNPLWFSTVISDPSASPPGYTGTSGRNGSGTGSNTSAQIFYLYDEPCDDAAWDGSGYAAPTGSHDTRNTAQISGSASSNSTCANSDPMKQPEAMGTQPPAGNSSTPIYEYSADLAGDYLGGLAMMRKGNTCRTSYSSSEAALNAANPSTTGYKFAVHSWATPPMKDEVFHLSARATVSVWTQTLGGLSGRGFLCASLIERRVSGGVPSDTTIASTNYDLSAWPVTPRRLSFTFTVSPQVDIDVDNQLVLVLHLRSESAQDIALLYDHPSYQSLLEIETTTPIGG
jgi:prepilin-type N-terminal cleavage/methylation domain-containing protein